MNIDTAIKQLEQINEMLENAIFEATKKANVPERVIYRGLTTVCKFIDGEVITAKPSVEDTYSKDVGLAMCLAKRLYGSRTAFLEAIENAEDQSENNETEITIRNLWGYRR
jgi:hypothetical protein